MRLVLDTKEISSGAHHMTSAWSGSGDLVFEDPERKLVVALGVHLQWQGGEDYGTVSGEGDYAQLFALDGLLVVRVAKAIRQHESVGILSAMHLVSTDGGVSWRKDPGFVASRLDGLRAEWSEGLM